MTVFKVRASFLKAIYIDRLPSPVYRKNPVKTAPSLAGLE